MAEGGEPTSIKDGSDADFEFACTPCGEDDIKEAAVKFCPECQEYLCDTCARHHGRLRATRSHKLIDKDDVKQGAAVAMMTKCRYHSDRDIEMFCGTHDMVYCTKCIATNHRLCSEVTNIEDVPKASIEQKEIKHLQGVTESIQGHLKSIGETRKTAIEALEEQRNDILEKFRELDNGLMEHICKLIEEASTALDLNYAEIKDDLESGVTMVTSLTSEIDESNRQLQSITNLDTGQTFVQLKLAQKIVTDAEKLLEESQSKETKKLNFTENTDLRESVMTTASIGKVEILTEYNGQFVPRRYKLKATRDINVKMQNDKKQSFISDACQLQDGTVILADRFNCKLKRLDKNYNLKDDLDLGASPLGICCTGLNEIAVKMNKKIQFIFVGTVFAKLRDISVDSGEFYGIACCGDELWVSNGSDVIVYSMTGKFLKSIGKDANGQKLFTLGTQHIAVHGDTVLVTDCGDGVVCFRKDGTVKEELRDQRLNNTKGVCVSSDGTVFLSGYKSHNVVMFNRDGNCVGELVGREHDLTNPLSLCFDENNKCIILTHLHYSDYIRRLEIRD